MSDLSVSGWRRFMAKDALAERAAAVALLGAGIGLVASFMLSIESFVLAKNNHAQLSCDINAAISCASVARHWSATLLGFPNSLIGLVTLPVIVTITVALLAGVRFPRWFMIGAQLGAVAGLLFAGWMFYMSMNVIGVLCPWCLTLDVGMILVGYGLTRYNVMAQVWGGPSWRRFIDKGFDTLLMAVCLVGLAIVVIPKLFA